MNEASGGRSGDEMFTVVSPNRMSEAIVTQIRTLIRTGRLRPGDRLPSERDLCERVGVSRVTVREALRVLEAAGLVDIRVGAHGGAFVTAPSSTKLGADLADLVTLSPLTPVEVTEARQVFENGIVPLVVARATEQDIADLNAMVDGHEAALREGTYGMPMSAAFHVRFAASAHNAVIESLVRSFHGPLLMSLREAQVAQPLMGHRGTVEHREIVAAVAAGDTTRAQALMAGHLRRTARRVARMEQRHR
ncbi:MAG TPA: FadR/GntR family transcriptional regulator [Pseudonocardiaceae bacterium]|jgi:DNA-binding FadR family transcriptional regulator|nr:FadR/GntR family transcriptional regulator [Pseudonocardiaceae bacterium]